jgi:predicted MPP superfamily phosphohydrolase
LEYAVSLVNTQQADLVAITGDFVTYHPAIYSNDLISSLSKLHAPDGVVAVLGNHDHWTDANEIRRVIERAHIRELKNEVISVVKGEEKLHICGVDDFMEGLARLDHVLEKLPGDGAAILLAHEPDFADISALSKRFDLQISGHSHGGQIVLPWIGAPFLPGYARKYTSGLHQVDGMLQYTNRGLGTSEIQIRFNCPPEITVFTLESVK